MPLHRIEVQSGKTHYVRFDRNDYSIPHTHVRRPLTLLAGDTEIRILDGANQIARHERAVDGPDRSFAGESPKSTKRTRTHPPATADRNARRSRSASMLGWTTTGRIGEVEWRK